MFDSQKPAAPSLFEVTLGALLSLVLGAVVAAGYLAAQPVETVRSLPKEPDADKIYYVTGSARSSLGRQWLRKKQVLVEQGAFDIELNEDELNTWVGSAKTAPAGEEEEGGIFTPKGINFRVDDGVFQIGLPCSFSLAGINRDLVVQARGDFVEQGGRYTFKPSELYVGTLNVATLPVVGDLVWKQLLATQEFPEDMTEGWNSLSSVTVEGKTLKLARK